VAVTRFFLSYRTVCQELIYLAGLKSGNSW
jgi:hypothetical protein